MQITDLFNKFISIILKTKQETIMQEQHQHRKGKFHTI